MIKRIKSAASILWFRLTHRRECCDCGCWLGASNPLSRSITHGICIDCELDVLRSLYWHRKPVDKTNNGQGDQSSNRNISLRKGGFDLAKHSLINSDPAPVAQPDQPCK